MAIAWERFAAADTLIHVDLPAITMVPSTWRRITAAEVQLANNVPPGPVH